MKGKLNDFMEKEGFITLSKDLTCKEALAKWRKLEKETGISDFVYITDKNNVMLGVVELKDLFLENPSEKIEDMMETDYSFVYEKQSISQAISTALNEKASELPVLNKKKQLIGLISTNKLLDALNWLNTKNVYNLAGILKAREQIELNATTLIRVVKDKIAWLVLAALMGILFAGNIIKNYEPLIVAIPSAVFFIPVLMGFGGNIGTQSSAIFVRVLARKEKSTDRKLFKLFLVDLLSGVIIGILLGALTAGSAILLFNEKKLALVLMISMMVISVLAVLLGFLVPFISSKLKLDPAFVSGPLVTSIKDIVALLVYFFLIQIMI